MMQEQFSDPNLVDSKKTPVNLVLFAISLIGIGGLIGASTNLVNGLVSEEYFRQIMGWNFEGIWIAAIFQGLFEGLIYGFIFSAIFTIGFASTTKMKADRSFAKNQLKKILPIIYLCWIIGGIVAVFLVVTFPEEYDRFIYAVPTELFARIRYAWVGGSIWGGMFGGIIAIIWGLVNTRKEWKVYSKFLKI